MKSGYTKINLEKSKASVNRGAERTEVREHPRTYKDIAANFGGSSSIQHNSENFRQDEFKGESAQRRKLREHRRDLQNSLVSSFMEYAVQDYCLILTTTNDLQITEKIADILLELNLAACIQIDDIKSYFRWDGKIALEKEYRIIIKTKSSNYNEIENKILEIHNYELPQIIKINIDYGFQKYLEWIDQNSK